MSTETKMQITSMLGPEGFLHDLPEQGFDMNAILNSVKDKKLSRTDIIDLMIKVLGLAGNAERKASIIKDSELFPQTTIGASRLVAIVTTIIPMHRRADYLAKVASIAQQDGDNDNELSKKEVTQVIFQSVEEILLILPLPSTGIFGIIKFTLPSLLPMLMAKLGPKS